MDCGYEQMISQQFNKKISWVRTTYDIAYFLINSLSLIKYKGWNYYFCVDYGNRRKCELCVIGDNFDDFENVVREKILEGDFILNYHSKLYPYLQRLFFAKNTACCCFLDEVYSFTYRLNGENHMRTFHLEEIIDELVRNKLMEKRKEFYSTNN